MYYYFAFNNLKMHTILHLVYIRKYDILKLLNCFPTHI